MVWHAGQSGNPKGRPVGARMRRDYEAFQRLKERGDTDPADYLSTRLTQSQDPQEKIQCAVALLPYIYSRNAARADPQYIEQSISLPVPSNIAEAKSNIAHAQGLFAEGVISGITADRLTSLNRAFIETEAVEQKILDLQEQNGKLDQIIRIQGGFPALPGTNIDMPDLNPALAAPTGEAASQSSAELVQPSPVEAEADTEAPA